jgi:hypothetical protein
LITLPMAKPLVPGTVLNAVPPGRPLIARKLSRCWLGALGLRIRTSPSRHLPLLLSRATITMRAQPVIVGPPRNIYL